MEPNRGNCGTQAILLRLRQHSGPWDLIVVGGGATGAGLVAAGFALKLSLEQQAPGRLAAVRLLPPGQPDEGIVADRPSDALT